MVNAQNAPEPSHVSNMLGKCDGAQNQGPLFRSLHQLGFNEDHFCPVSSLICANIFVLIYCLNLDTENATVAFWVENLGTGGFLNFLCNEQQPLVSYNYHYKCYHDM